MACGFTLAHSLYWWLEKKTLKECETALKTQYKTLSFCLFVFCPDITLSLTAFKANLIKSRFYRHQVKKEFYIYPLLSLVSDFGDPEPNLDMMMVLTKMNLCQHTSIAMNMTEMILIWCYDCSWQCFKWKSQWWKGQFSFWWFYERWFPGPLHRLLLFCPVGHLRWLRNCWHPFTKMISCPNMGFHHIGFYVHCF